MTVGKAQGFSIGVESSHLRPVTAATPSRFGNPHRTASWALATLSLASLSVAALGWSLLLEGRWTILSITSVLTTFFVLFSGGHYRVNMNDGGWLKLRASVGASAFGVIAALLVVSIPGLGEPPVRGFATLMAALIVAAVASRMAGRWLLEKAWKQGHLRATALVFGDDDLASEMALELRVQPERGVDVVGFVSTKHGSRRRRLVDLPVFPVDPTLDRASLALELEAAAREAGATRLIVGPAGAGSEQVAQAAARWAIAENMAVHVVPRFHEMGMGLDAAMAPDIARGYPIVRMQRAAHPTLSLKIKRLLDIGLAGLAIVVLSPILLGAALAVRLSSPGPILFRQDRIGERGRLISVPKFRSMTEAGDGDTEWDASYRITPIGRLLRATNIDELPQLFSIVSGDMSLVGPRPERPAFVEKFSAEIPHYDDRHRMPVGLTGLAQVMGLRGDTSISERVKYDNLYIDQWSLRADFEILARTATAVLFQKLRSKRMNELDRAVKGSTDT